MTLLRRAAWPATCLTLVGAYLAATLVPAGGEAWTILSHGSVVTAASLVAGLACTVAGRRARGAERLGWHLLGAGLLSAAAGNGLWLWYELTGPAGAPVPSAADVFVIAMIPLALAGAAALGGLRGAGVRVVLDGLIVSGSLLFLSWCTVLGPLVQASSPSALATVVTFASPIGDVALASVAFILLARADRRRRHVFALVGCGMLAVAVAESGFAYMMQIGAYSAGNLAMNGWVVGYLLIGTGALRSAGARATADRPASPVRHALPYVPLVVALIAGVRVNLTRGGIGTFAYLLTIVIVVLVVVRQLVALRDNVRLTRDLRAALDNVRRREDELRHLATHDPLTGLPNRSVFETRGRAAAAVLYLDLDGFKQVNDTLGHACGDALLVAVAGRLRGCVRPADTVVRLGGDEFAILIAEPTTPADLERQAERVARAIDEPFRLDGEPAVIGASVGAAGNGPGEQHTVEELLRRADRSMYAAKTRRKGRSVRAE